MVCQDSHNEDFITFTELLNAHQASIKIKFTVHKSEVNFLDVVCYKGPNFPSSRKLDFKVYFKETDTHSLLHKHSFHPRHTFRGIVKSQLLRVKRICTEQRFFFSATNSLSSIEKAWIFTLVPEEYTQNF